MWGEIAERGRGLLAENVDGGVAFLLAIVFLMGDGEIGDVCSLSCLHMLRMRGDWALLYPLRV